MTKHIDIVEEVVKSGKKVNRDMFLHERNVRNLAIKIVRETYMLDKYNASSVKLWVQENPDSVFCYTKTNVPAQGELNSSNMPFTLWIQTKWQKKMMLKFGHHNGVSIDATFGTNDKKVRHLLSIYAFSIISACYCYCNTNIFFSNMYLSGLLVCEQ